MNLFKIRALCITKSVGTLVDSGESEFPDPVLNSLKIAHFAVKGRRKVAWKVCTGVINVAFKKTI